MAAREEHGEYVILRPPGGRPERIEVIRDHRLQEAGLAAYALGKCRACKETTRAAGWKRDGDRYGYFRAAVVRVLSTGDVRPGIGGLGEVPCRSCGRVGTDGRGSLWVRWAVIRASYSAAHECNAKCQNARGPACECSCAGANHGREHAA